jgi:hypothetical protein
LRFELIVALSGAFVGGLLHPSTVLRSVPRSDIQGLRRQSCRSHGFRLHVGQSCTGCRMRLRCVY